MTSSCNCVDIVVLDADTTRQVIPSRLCCSVFMPFVAGAGGGGGGSRCAEGDPEDLRAKVAVLEAELARIRAGGGELWL